MKAMYYSYPNVAANTIVLGYSVRIGKENESLVLQSSLCIYTLGRLR